MGIVLSMIVKDEQDVIARCLNSVKHIISKWIISDTGSSDRTVEIIKETLKDIPGFVLHNNWVNFGHNRQQALEAAQSLADKDDYILFIDADEYLKVSPEFKVEDLKTGAVNIMVDYANIKYARTALVSNRHQWFWRDILHEYLESDTPATFSVNEHITVQVTTEGARSKNPDKFKLDAALLQKAVDEGSTSTRHYFYLAQSYRDAGMLEQALDWYRKRAQTPGWEEEAWYSQYQTALTLWKLQRAPEEVIAAFEVSIFRRPQRMESITKALEYLRYKGLFLEGLKLVEKYYTGDHFSLYQKTPTDTLFVEKECYYWKFWDEYALVLYFLGHKKHAEIYWTFALTDTQLTTLNQQRIANNIKHCQ